MTLEELPSGETDRRGWWADLISEPANDQIGSRLWTLARLGKVLEVTAVEQKSILEEAFEWMLEDGIASSIVVESAINGPNEITGNVKIFRPNGDNIPFKFIWDGQGLKLLE